MWDVRGRRDLRIGIRWGDVRYRLEDLSIDGRIILKCVLNK
jgi:hypothetical protein